MKGYLAFFFPFRTFGSSSALNLILLPPLLPPKLPSVVPTFPFPPNLLMWLLVKFVTPPTSETKTPETRCEVLNPVSPSPLSDFVLPLFTLFLRSSFLFQPPFYKSFFGLMLHEFISCLLHPFAISFVVSLCTQFTGHFNFRKYDHPSSSLFFFPKPFPVIQIPNVIPPSFLPPPHDNQESQVQIAYLAHSISSPRFRPLFFFPPHIHPLEPS